MRAIRCSERGYITITAKIVFFRSVRFVRCVRYDVVNAYLYKTLHSRRIRYSMFDSRLSSTGLLKFDIRLCPLCRRLVVFVPPCYKNIRCPPLRVLLRRIDIIAYSHTTKKGYIIDPTIRIETGSSQPEDVDKEKINIYLPTVDYFKAKYQLEDIEVIGLLIGARGVIPKFFESFRKTFELPQTFTADFITSVLKRSCQILGHHIHSV
ncbi:hypothetical protein ANN_02177 [Periplaneta americana]|uniref:Uncharacterized protein n=1 Tax=Periplaneta americana TaxID=6978 RepID=A0ABQ8TVJ9_PERAM|nr:hypothetical protein ANN_02177 [Periplaneta americana]